MPDALYRAMKSDPDSKPRTGDTARSLGVRPRDDIPIDESGRVQPGKGGMSTAANDPRELPAHRKPKWLDGTGADPIFELRPILLPNALTARQDGRPNHYLVEPTDECLFHVFQGHLWSTRQEWVMIVP
jgi:hypothetical protein